MHHLLDEDHVAVGLVLARGHAAEGEVGVEDVLALAARGLAVVDHEPLEDLERSEGLEAHTLGPGLVDHTVATDAVRWQGAIYDG